MKQFLLAVLCVLLMVAPVFPSDPPPVDQEVVLGLLRLDSKAYNDDSTFGRFDAWGKQAVPALVAALKDQDAKVRIRAARRLGLFEDAAVIPYLKEALKDPDRKVTNSVAWALARMKDRSGIPLLVSSFRNTSSDISQDALWRILDLKDSEAMAALLDFPAPSRRQMVMPLKNLTGDPSLDWLSIGLQDSLTVDLWYVPTFNTLALEDYTRTASVDLKQALESARDKKLDTLWWGEVKGARENLSLVVTVLDVATGREIARQEAIAPLDRLLAESSRVVVELTEQIGTPVNEDVRKRILSTKTGSVEAWRMNAEGYRMQKLYDAEDDEAKKGELKGPWRAMLKRAIELDGDYAEAWNNLGWHYEITERSKDAGQAFSEAIKRKPHLIDALMGIELANRGEESEYENILTALERAMTFNPTLEVHQKIFFGFLMGGLKKSEAKSLDLYRRMRQSHPRFTSLAISYLVKFENRDMVALLQSLLKDDSPKIRSSALWGLRKLKFSDPVPDVISLLLNDPDDVVRKDAAETLESLSGQQAVPALRQALKDPSPTVRKSSISALGKLSGLQSVEEIVSLLKDPDARVRAEAVNSLGYLDYRQALPAVKGMLSDPSPKVRMSALSTLGATRDSRLLPAILPLLNDPDDHVVSMAVYQLGRLGDKSGVDALLKLYPVKNREVKGALLWSFHALGDRRALPVVLELIRDDDSDVRSSAAKALENFDGQEAFDALMGLLSDQDAYVRLYAAKALGAKHHRGGVAEIVRKLETLNYSDSSFVRFMNSSFLLSGKWSQELRNESDLEYFLPLLIKDTVTEQDLEGVLDGLKSSASREKACSILDRLEFRKAAPAIIASLDKDYKSPVCVETLAMMNDPRAAPLFERILKESGRSEVRSAIALHRLGRPAGYDALVHLLGASSDSHDGDMAALYLASIGDRLALPRLNSMLSAGDFSYAGAVIPFADQSSVPPLRAILRNKNITDSSKYDSLVALLRLGSPVASAEVSALLESNPERYRFKFVMDAVQLDLTIPEGWLEEELGRCIYCLGTAGYKNKGNLILQQLAEKNRPAPIYRLFARTSHPMFFNPLRKKLLFAPEVSEVLASPVKRVQASGWYLKALQAREAGDPEAQRSHAVEALRLLDPRYDTSLAILVQLMRAHAELKQQKYAEALASVKAAEEYLQYLTRRDEDDYEELLPESVRFLKGEVLTASGDAKGAIGEFQVALDSLARDRHDPRWREPAERLEGMVRRSLGGALVQMGKANLERGVEIARNLKAADSVEMENEEKGYLELARQRLGEGSYEEAQKLIEELNLRRTDYGRRRQKIVLADAARQRQVEAHREKQRELDEIARKIQEQGRIKAQNSSGDASLRAEAEIRQLEEQRKLKQRELQVFLTSLKRTYPDIAMLMGAKPLELSTVQEQLPAEVALLQYLLLADRLITFVIRKEGIDIVETPLNRDALKQKVEAYRSAITGRTTLETVTSLSRELNDLLIAPVEQAGKLKGITTLGIAPNGFLHYLPFTTLANVEGKYLLERYTVFGINSTSLLWVAMDRAKKGGSKAALLALGNPDGTLPAAEREVEAIGRLYPGSKVYRTTEARKKILVEQLPASSLVHLSTHGILDPRDSTRSHLVMADGPLSIEEIWGLPLNGTRLTTLSACDTGMGEILSGDDIVSLENAFIYAGSPSVVSTLWPVADESTAKLMERFYAALSQGKGKAEALRSAQLEMIRGEGEGGTTERGAVRLKASKGAKEVAAPWSHPYYWAAFVLRGEWR